MRQAVWAIARLTAFSHVPGDLLPLLAAHLRVCHVCAPAGSVCQRASFCRPTYAYHSGNAALQSTTFGPRFAQGNGSHWGPRLVALFFLHASACGLAVLQ